MAITDPTIDSVTGLPVLNPQDVIQQIPLGVQIFPYEDLLATSRPTRGPLAGEDILPVSSMTAGQHPSTGSAQTVGTDGNHRLLVSVDGSGGGSGVQTFVPIQVELSGRIGLDPQFISLPDVLAYKYMVGYHASFLPIDGGGGQNASPFIMQLNFNTAPTTRIDLMWAYAQYSISDTSYHSLTVNTTAYFPFKMDISAIVAAGATSCELDCNGAADGSIWTASMIFSNV